MGFDTAPAERQCKLTHPSPTGGGPGWGRPAAAPTPSARPTTAGAGPTSGPLAQPAARPAAEQRAAGPDFGLPAETPAAAERIAVAPTPGAGGGAAGSEGLGAQALPADWQSRGTTTGGGRVVPGAVSPAAGQIGPRAAALPRGPADIQAPSEGLVAQAATTDAAPQPTGDWDGAVPEERSEASPGLAVAREAGAEEIGAQTVAVGRGSTPGGLAERERTVSAATAVGGGRELAPRESLSGPPLADAGAALLDLVAAGARPAAGPKAASELPGEAGLPGESVAEAFLLIRYAFSEGAWKSVG